MLPFAEKGRKFVSFVLLDHLHLPERKLGVYLRRELGSALKQQARGMIYLCRYHMSNSVS